MLKTKRSKFISGLALCGFLLLALAFPFGPLFPWSPLKLGYNHVSHARAEVFYGAADALLADYASVDQMMNEAEAFHGLRYQRRVRVIECKDWQTCERALPWMGNIHGLGGVTLSTGDVIYITPKLKEKQFSTAEFLRHELSHAVLSQNTTLVKSYKLNNEPWFFEGLAVSFGKQRNYIQRDEWLTRAKQESLLAYLDPAHPASPWNARFAYPTQRYFVEYLRAKFGEERFHQFLTKNIANPEAWRATFASSYDQPFETIAQQYEQAVKTGQWLPAE